MRILFGVSKGHNGIDFACPVGTPIQAVEDGSAERAGWENPFDPSQGYGLRIMQRIRIDGATYFAFYAHCNKLMVNEGDKILKGQTIAETGNTGRSTGPHLHFGVRKADTREYYDVEFVEAGDNSGLTVI
jgi:murein DD-endopeptidase MepM/ murein hydrolase activator NlpD